MTDPRTRWFALAAIMLAAALTRLLPHPPNFNAVGAIALFGGATFSDRRAALLVPIAALLLSDLVLGIHRLMPLVYALFGLTVVIGFLLRSRRGALPVASAAIAAATIFYLVTNAAVWSAGHLYPATLEGLVACYVAALPFYGNGVAGNVFFCGLLFGGWALLERGVPSLRASGVHA